MSESGASHVVQQWLIRNAEAGVEGNVIGEQTIQTTIYEAITKLMIRRLERAIPGSSEEAFSQLSLAALLNLLFLLNGEFGSLGDFVATHKALRTLLGDQLLWAEPQKSTPVIESIN